MLKYEQEGAYGLYSFQLLLLKYVLFKYTIGCSLRIYV